MPDKDRGQVNFAVVMAGILGQAGCVTLLFVIGALVLGLWLDARYDTRPLFTLLFVLGSVPITMYLLFRMVMSNTDRLQRMADSSLPKSDTQEGDGGTDT